MKAKEQIHEWESKAETSGGGIIKGDYRGSVYYEGGVQTPYGYVIVYSQGFDSGTHASTSLRFVHNGRFYY